MIKIYLLLFGLFSIFLAGCQSNPTPDLPPKACFTASSMAIRNQMIIFDGTCSENADSYLWDFGDGEMSEQQNPTHAFKINGDYFIKLLVARNELKDSIIQKIVIDLSADEIKCKPTYIVGAAIWPAAENDSVTFSYDGDKLSDIKWYYRSVSKFYNVRMNCDYDEDGRLLKFSLLNVVAFNPIEEKLISTMYIKRSSNHRPSRIDWVNVWGDSLRTWRYSYDDVGRLNQIVSRVPNDDIYLTRYQFNANGNCERTDYTFENLGKNYRGRENRIFDSSLPFYSASKELKIFFEDIINIEPNRNNPKTTKIFLSVDPGGTIRYWGDGALTQPNGIELQNEIKINEKGLTTAFRVKNYLVSGIYYRAAGYDCD